MPLQNALAREATSSCNPETFGFSSALPGSDVVTRTFSLLRPWSAGLLLTLVQLVVAVFLLAPEGPLSYRWLFRVALSDGAHRFYLLEQLRRPGRENFGCSPRNRDVGHANCRRSMRCISSRALCF